MNQTMIAKVTTSGQVSLPASVRRRWMTSQVVIADEGDHIVVRPLPNDPIAAACGSLRRGGPETDKVRAQERRAESERERSRRAR